MKYLLSLILTLLIALPNCGMVFARAQDGVMDHAPMMLMDMDAGVGSGHVESYEYIGNGSSWKSCCTESSSSTSEREGIRSFSLPEVSSLSSIPVSIPDTFSCQDISQYVASSYRPHAPPGTSEYISLIGISTKRLD